MSDAQPAPSYVAVIRDRQGAPSGMGILITSDTIITCAHVINEAIGRDTDTAEQPNDDTRLDVSFPFSGQSRKSKIQEWFGPGARSSRRDFCILQLQAPLPEEDAEIARFAITQKNIAFKCCSAGEKSPLEWAYGRVADIAENGYYQVEQIADKPFLRQGFSGGPIISESGDTIGMVVRVTPERKVGHIWSTEYISALSEDVRRQIGQRVAALANSAPPQGGKSISAWPVRSLTFLCLIVIGLIAYVLYEARIMRSLECKLSYQTELANSTLTLLLSRKSKEDSYKQESSLQRVRAMLAQLNGKVALKQDTAFTDLNSEINSMVGEIIEERKAIEKGIESAEHDKKQNEQQVRTCENGQ
jgi:hypothetical protein